MTVGTFKEAKRKLGTGISVGVWGRPKVGKSQFALTFPEPVFYIDLENGISELLMQLRFKEKKVYVANYQLSELGDLSLTAKESADIMKEVFANMKAACAVGEGTIVVDTASRFWSLAQKVYLDDLEKQRQKAGKDIYPFDYGRVNFFFEQLLLFPRQAPNMSLVLVHRASEVYNEKGNVMPGQFKMQAFKDTEYLVSVNVRLFKESGKFMAEIQSCRRKPELEWQRFENMDFPTLKELLG